MPASIFTLWDLATAKQSFSQQKCVLRLQCVMPARLSPTIRRVFSKLFTRPTPCQVTESMDSADLMQLSKEELVGKIKALEETCKSMKKRASNPQSKYEGLVKKFDKFNSKRRKNKLFVPTSCGQRKIALRVAYFGWDYMGLQGNPGLDDTIEKIVFLALTHTKLLVSEIEDSAYSKCGRTDKGVSAFSQVLCLNLRSKVAQANTSAEAVKDNHEENAACNASVKNSSHGDCTEPSESAPPVGPESDKSPSAVEELDYCSILNSILPNEIKVIGWAAIDDENFSARYSCVGRLYKYFFPRGSLNIEAMNDAAKLFVGTHDFRNFCKMNVEERIVFVRELRGFDVAIDNVSKDSYSPYQMCVATINGTGFLYHQVRYMMGILFLIGMGFEEASVITELLDVEKMPRRPQYGLMADYPLTLYDCHFDNLKWNISEIAHKKLTESLQQFWSTSAIKTTLARSMLEKFISENTSPRSENLETTTDEKSPIFTTDVPNFYITGHLLKERFTSKQYKKVTKRLTGTSLEEKIESMENRKKRKLERLGMENDE